jgi:ferredoxin
MPKVTVQIDPSACILAANCVGIEPNLFQIAIRDLNPLTHSEARAPGTTARFPSK